MLAVACALGEPVGYVQEHGGGIVQNIVPARETEGRQVSTSSNVTLAWHTETAFHPYKPRYLLLLCLRGDPAAATLLCSVADCLPHLDAQTIATLREPRFRTRPDESFLEPGTIGALGAPMAILDRRERPTFTYDEDLMVGIDPGAQAALDRLRAVVRDHASMIVLEPGDLLVVDNDRVVHGRTSFAARFDGTDRWLQRAFVVADLAPSAAERTGRIITTRSLIAPALLQMRRVVGTHQRPAAVELNTELRDRTGIRGRSGSARATRRVDAQEPVHRTDQCIPVCHNKDGAVQGRVDRGEKGGDPSVQVPPTLGTFVGDPIEHRFGDRPLDAPRRWRVRGHERRHCRARATPG